MVAGQGTPNDDVRSGTETHEEFLQLCALSTSGTLTEEEQKKCQFWKILAFSNANRAFR